MIEIESVPRKIYRNGEVKRYERTILREENIVRKITKTKADSSFKLILATVTSDQKVKVIHTKIGFVYAACPLIILYTITRQEYSSHYLYKY